MTLQTKKRVLVALLAAFLVWPFVHRALVAHYLISPWKMFGWAMYCVPDHPPDVRFLAATREGMGELQFPEDYAAQVEKHSFLNRRVQLGRLEEPDLLAALLFDRYPNITRLMIEVAQPRYSTESDSFELQVDRYEFEPSGR